MPEAYVVEAVRTAVGKRNGGLSGVHPVDLGAAAWRGLFDRVDVDPGAVDDVIAGCLDTIGGQAGNIARLSWLAAGYPEEVPGVTVDRQCGSSQQAISFGAQAIMSGTADLIVAGGMQNMSQIPISSAMIVGDQFGFTSPTNESKGWLHRYGDQEISQFRGSELIAERWNISREEMEQFAFTSHQRAFAPVVMAWLKEIKADPEKVNPSGGAIALGHPLGATGAKLFTTMLNTLERTGGRYGLQTMCEGGGTANVTIIERL